MLDTVTTSLKLLVFGMLQADVFLMCFMCCMAANSNSSNNVLQKCATQNACRKKENDELLLMVTNCLNQLEIAGLNLSFYLHIFHLFLILPEAATAIESTVVTALAEACCLTLELSGT